MMKLRMKPRIQGNWWIEAIERRLLLSTASASLLADVSVRNNIYADANYGGAPTLLIQNAANATDTQITFLKFDISSVANINSATLELNGSLLSAGDPSVTAGVFAVSDSSWSEGTGDGTLGLPADGVTWNTQPSILSAINGATAAISSQKSRIQSFNLTNYIQSQKLLGNSAISLAVESLTPSAAGDSNSGNSGNAGGDIVRPAKKKTATGIVQFDSREGGVAPALVIDYTTPAPRATLTTNDITSSGTHQTVVAEYSGILPIDVSSIAGGGNGNLKISGPSKASVGEVTINSSNPDDVFATYTINPPNHSAWATGNNGTYTVTLGGRQVTDISGAGAGSAGASFNVNVPVPDIRPPAATILATGYSIASFAPEQIVVTYKDAGNVDAGTIATSNLTVTGPSGALSIASVTKTSEGNAQTITATYTVTPLHDGWSFASNGIYQVSLAAGSVRDASGNGISATSANFVVNISTPPDPNDATFNGGSPVSTPFKAEGTAVLSNGKVVIVGEKGDSAAGNSQGVIELFNADGTIASEFGDGGFVTTPAASNESFHAVLAQGTSFIVAGSGGGFLLQRYNTAGQLDGSFGKGGSVVTNFGASSTNEAVFALALNPNGTIAAGGTSDGNVAFAEYDSSGNMVVNFGQPGRGQLFDVGSPTDVIGSIAFQSNGDLIAVGSSGSQVVIVRLNTSGNADTSFGSSGLVIVPGLVANTSQAAGDHTEGLAIEPDNSILVANQTTTAHFGVVHLDANGTPMPAFGANGLATASFGANDDADAVYVESGGQIVVAGTTDLSGTPTALAAFDQTGAPIASFGLLGKLTLPASVGGSAPLISGSHVTSAFGTQTADGHLVLGTNGISSSSIIRKLSVGGFKNVNAATSLGFFGATGRKNVKLTVSVNNANVTLSVVGGSGEAFFAGNRLHLVIAAGTRGATLTIAIKGGSRRVTLGDLTVTGTLHSLVNKGVDLAGTLSATGAIGTLSIGNVRGGTIAAGGGINSVSLLSASDAHILAGANLGTDGELGGQTSDADRFSSAVLRTFKVTGSLSNSVIAAGVDPVDGIFLDSDDKLVSGTASVIRYVKVTSIDSATRFIAGAFGTARIPLPVDPAADIHFKVL